jgi:hypothetical protein
MEPYEVPGVVLPVPGLLIFDAIGPTPNLRAVRSPVLFSQTTGTMRLRVVGNRFRGTYKFAPVRIDTLPETVNGQVSVNVVAGERLDPPGDTDIFSFNCFNGQELAGFLTIPGGGNILSDIMMVISPPSGGAYSVGPGKSLYEGQSTGRFVVGTNGKCRIAITPPSPHVGVLTTGLGSDYQFIVYPINRKPELVGEIIQVGDTVEETFANAVDVDEFVLTLAPGSRFDVCIHELSPPPATEADAPPLARVVVPLPAIPRNDAVSNAGDLQPACVGPFTGPVTGAVRMTVNGSNLIGGRYRLSVRSAP